MKPIIHGNGFSRVEVTNINKHGLWLITRDHELFISFKEFPQFQDATLSKIMKVEQPNPNLLHWPDLSIDLAIASVRCFPLASRQSFSTPRSGRQAKTKPVIQSRNGLRSAPIENLTQRTTQDLSEDSALPPGDQ